MDEEEYVVYDFNELDNGILTVCSESGGNMRMHTTLIDIFTIDGAECPYYHLENTGVDYFDKFPITDSYIEGIGRLYNGCLPWCNADELAGALYNTKYPGYIPKPCRFKTELLRVTDLDGNIIFDSMQVGVESMDADSSSYGNMFKIEDDMISSSGPSGGFLTISDISGRMVMSTEIKDASGVSISALPRGVYVAMLTTSDGSSSLKFMR